MLEARTSPARSRLGARSPVFFFRVARRLRERADALRRIAAAIATGVAFAGCVAPPDQGTADAIAEELLQGDPAHADHGPSAHRGGAAWGAEQDLSLLEVPCLPGAWISPPRACACPATRDPHFTPECTASDCQEADLLLLLPCGDAVSAVLRYSGDRQGLSAVGGDPQEGTWSYHDDGELRLELDGNAIYTPTECDDGELQMKAHPLMTHPPAALDAAIFWAWLLEEWTDVPYFP